MVVVVSIASSLWPHDIESIGRRKEEGQLVFFLEQDLSDIDFAVKGLAQIGRKGWSKVAH